MQFPNTNDIWGDGAYLRFLVVEYDYAMRELEGADPRRR